MSFSTGGAIEVWFTDLSLGTERGKGGRDVGLRASRRLDNQAEWQLLVHMPSTPCSQHCHGNSSCIQGFQAFLLPEAAFTLPLLLLTSLLPQSDGLGEAVSLESLRQSCWVPAGHRAETSIE